MLSNSDAEEDSWEFLDSKEIKPVNPKGNQPWILIGRTDAEAEVPVLLATWYKKLTHWKRPWCWERQRAGGEGEQRLRWLDYITDQCTWVWAHSRGQWRMEAWHAVVRGVTKSRTWLNNNRNFLSVTCAFILITQTVFLIKGYGWKS